MQPLQFLVPLAPFEAAQPYIPTAVLVLALVNMGTRILAHRSYVSQAESGADDVDRFLPHSVVTFLLVLASLAYLVVAPHAGMVTAVLVLGVLLTDFFEFESRRVEVRNGMEIERPKSAVTASVLVLLYAAYQSVFFVIQPYWDAIV